MQRLHGRTSSQRILLLLQLGQADATRLRIVSRFVIRKGVTLVSWLGKNIAHLFPFGIGYRSRNDFLLRK